MSPLHSDWSHAGLKGLIPSALHYSLLGYNFFIPDTVGNVFFPFSLAIIVFSWGIFAALHVRGAWAQSGYRLASSTLFPEPHFGWTEGY